MDFKEFVKNNPAEATTAAQCKSLEEFKKLADDHGIKFEDEKTAEEAFKYVKDHCANAELDEDALTTVAGGKAGGGSREIVYEVNEKTDLARTEDGTTLFVPGRRKKN